MLNSCLHSLTPSEYGSKQLSLSPVTTPSKVVTDSNYVGSLSELEGFHVLDIKVESNEDLDIKYINYKYLSLIFNQVSRVQSHCLKK